MGKVFGNGNKSSIFAAAKEERVTWNLEAGVL